MELDFAEDTVDLLWLDNGNPEDSLVFKEAYRDNKNSPHAIVDRVNTRMRLVQNYTIFLKRRWTELSECWKEDVTLT